MKNYFISYPFSLLQCERADVLKSYILICLQSNITGATFENTEDIYNYSMLIPNIYVQVRPGNSEYSNKTKCSLYQMFLV